MIVFSKKNFGEPFQSKGVIWLNSLFYPPFLQCFALSLTAIKNRFSLARLETIDCVKHPRENRYYPIFPYFYFIFIFNLSKIIFLLLLNINSGRSFCRPTQLPMSFYRWIPPSSSHPSRFTSFSRISSMEGNSSPFPN